MPTKTEQTFADKMAAEGWKVYRNGFPDYLCVKDSTGILAEVKSNSKDALKKHQIKMLNLLTSYRLKAYVWSPDNPEPVPFQKFQDEATKRTLKAPRVTGTKETNGKQREGCPLRVENLINYSQAAKILGISRPTVYVLIEKGQLRPFEIAERRYLVKEEVLRLREQLKNESAQVPK